MTTPRRRWPRFSLRTLFVVLTVFGCWLGYHVRWIQQRRDGREWLSAHHTFSTVVVLDDGPTKKLPWSLAILGETPIDQTALLSPQENEHYNPTEYRRRIVDMERLFPECTFVDWGHGWAEPDCCNEVPADARD